MLPASPGPVWGSVLAWDWAGSWARQSSAVQHGFLRGELWGRALSAGVMFCNLQVSEVLGYSEEIVGSEDMIEAQLDMPVECVQVLLLLLLLLLAATTTFLLQETIVTDSSFHLGDQIIYGDELIVTSEDVPQSEEIVGGGADSDPYVGMYESVPIPNMDSNTVSSAFRHYGVSGLVSKKAGKIKVKREFDLESLSEGRLKNSGSWQQKQVSIKTLEGEFSVTMWASGPDEGEF